jgi:hypothetical protein
MVKYFPEENNKVCMSVVDFTLFLLIKNTIFRKGTVIVIIAWHPSTNK